MSRVAIGYGGEPLVEALMRLVGLWQDDEKGNPTRFPVNFVIECRQDEVVRVYVEEQAARKTEEECKKIVTTCLLNKEFVTAQPPIFVGPAEEIVIGPDLTVEVKPCPTTD